MINSLKLKFWLALVLLVVAATSSILWTTTIYMGQKYFSQQQENLFRAGDKLAEYVLAERDIEKIFHQMEIMGSYLNANITLTDAAGRVLICTGRAGFPRNSCQMWAGDIIPQELVKNLLSGKKVAVRVESKLLKQDVLFTGVPVVFQNQVLFAILLQAPVKEISGNFFELIKINIFSTIVGIIFATILAFWLSTSITKPLVQIKTAAQKIANKDFSHRISYQGKDELGDIVQTINQMAAQLEKYINAYNKREQNRREFLANVSHELRTPLTIIQGYTEALLDGIVTDAKIREEHLRNILREAERLKAMANELLDLASIEEGREKLKFEKIDLANFAQDCFNAFRTQFFEKGIEFELDVKVQEGKVVGDRSKLVRVVENLLSNALKFTPSGGKVKLGVIEREKDYQIIVMDSGSGIPEEDLDKIFERFYKVDKARSSKGFGLGLAITKSIVEAHGGQIFARNNPEGGAKFTVVLPKLPPSADSVLPNDQ
ncbi:two-component sensor histidine kinase [Carboxydothermus islandicus]|uniref:histidine kinase n=1 Tax=Carboxydothermus islandicus TaxID=661089 RepID=A0A1L8D490_9THEO|nr:HAMP domain-containing sensor histidine kinase [Carboxydothermus islandicus]GAV25891.1 two-component sensor histidine kinase [Carboxydothermus islandicus]